MNQEKILVIDDEIIIFEALSNYLQMEYQLFHALNGEEGLKLFEEHQPDLILLDIRMPVMDGFEFLKKMETTCDSSYSVIVLTGHARGKEIMRCFDMGISSFLRKPFNLYEVKGLIRQCLNAKQLYKVVQEKEKSIRSLIDRSLDMILFVDKHFNIVEFNPAAQAQFAYLPEEVMGRNWAILFSDSSQEALAKSVDVSTGNLSQEVHLRRKSGEMFPSFFSSFLILDEKGGVAGMVCHARDMSAEKALAKLTREKRDLEVFKMTMVTVNDAVRNSLNALMMLRFQAEDVQGIDENVIEQFDDGMEQITDFLSKISTIQHFSEKKVPVGKALDMDASQ